MNTPTITTKRLILRKFTDSDIDDMLVLYRDEEVNRFLPWFPLKTRVKKLKIIFMTIFCRFIKNRLHMQ